MKILHISFNHSYYFSDICIDTSETNTMVVGQLIDRYLDSELQSVHIIADSIEVLDLVLALCHSIKTYRQSLCTNIILESEDLAAYYEYYNHLAENEEKLVVNNQSYEGILFDAIAVFNDKSIYDSMSNTVLLESKIYSIEQFNIPRTEEIDQYANAYISQQLTDSMKQYTREQKEAFLKMIGLDRNNLRNVLGNDDLIPSVFDYDYTWNDLFGPEMSFDIGAYINENYQKSEEYYNDCKEQVLERILNNIEQIINQYKDISLIYEFYNIENPKSIYSMIANEKKASEEYYDEKKAEVIYNEALETYHAAQNEKALFGKFGGKREQRVQEFFEKLDLFVSESYEQHRFETMFYIYDQVLDKLKQNRIQIALQDTMIPPVFYSIFSDMNIANLAKDEILENMQMYRITDYSPIYTSYLSSQGITQGTHLLAKNQLTSNTTVDDSMDDGICKIIVTKDINHANYIKGDSSFIQSKVEKVQVDPNIALVIQGIQKKCCVFTDEKASIYVYENPEFKNFDESSPMKEVVDEIKKYQHGPKAVKRLSVVVQSKNDYQAISSSPRSMTYLNNALKVIDETSRYVEKLKSLL